MDEDELKVLKHISNHPNFVKTYLVANKNDGKFKQVILMEKCGMYLINLTLLFCQWWRLQFSVNPKLCTINVFLGVS